MAATFDGVDDVYQLANESTLRYEYTQAFSGHAWIRKQALTGFCILGKAQSSGPQRGWAFNTENIGPGNLGISFHLVNNGASAHAFKQGFAPVGGTITALQTGLWVPVGFTYTGSGTIAGMKLYVNGVEVSDAGGSADTLAGGTIKVDGVPLRLAGFDTEFWAGALCGVVIVPATLSAAEMLALADIRNLYRNPNAFLSTPADVWLPMADRGAALDLSDYSGNGHDASVSSGAPAVVASPEVVLDTIAIGSITTTTTVAVVPNGHVEAVVVGIVQNTASTDRITGVTYGGVPMTRVATDGLAQDTVGEPGAAYAYLLGSGVPQGNQNVGITVGAGTEAKQVYVATLNSLGEVRVAASGRVQADVANPSVTLATLSTFVGIVVNYLFSGQNAPSGITAPSGVVTFGPGTDFGNQSAIAYVGNKEGASVAAGWTATSDDVAMIALALAAFRSAPPSMRRRRRTRTLSRL